MDYLLTLVNSVYAYCTDLTINLANLLNLSYYEINFVLFCLLYPTLIVSSVLLYTIQKIRLKRIKKHD